jgi:hypothetical protein
MEINDELRELILVGASALELKKKAMETGNDHAAPQRPHQRRSGPDHLEEVCAKRFCKRRKTMAGITLSELLEEDDRAGRQRLAPFHQQRAARSRARQIAPAGYAAAHRGGYQGAGLQRAHRRAEAPPGGKPRAGLLLRLEEPGAFPRQHLPPARRGGRRLPYHSMGDQDLRRAWACPTW